MRCPFCSDKEDRVVDSRLSSSGDEIRRRRECGECGRRYTTYERVADVFPKIVKRDGSREDFDRTKLQRGIELACTKRPISVEQIGDVVDAVERRLQNTSKDEIDSEWIGSAVTSELKELDPVAYIRFASVYHAFGDIQEFLEELRGFDDESGSTLSNQ